MSTRHLSFNALSLLLLLFGSFLSTPAISAQADADRDIGATARSCATGTAYRYVWTDEGEALAAFESTSACIAAARDGSWVGTSFIRTDLVFDNEKGAWYALFFAEGLAPGSSTMYGLQYNDGTVFSKTIEPGVGSDGRFSATFNLYCSSDIAAITMSGTAVGGASLSATLKDLPCHE
jgi:hypothetical protein